MMKHYYIIFLLVGTLLSLVSCKEDTGIAETEGILKLSVGVSDKVEVVSRSLAEEEQSVLEKIARFVFIAEKPWCKSIRG